MKDKFAELEGTDPRTVFSVLGLLLFVAAFLAYRWSGEAPIPISGVVQSTSSVSLGKVNGGTQQVASVLLNDGTIVPAYIVSGGLVSAGDNVRLLKERRFLGGSAYEVVGKEAP